MKLKTKLWLGVLGLLVLGGGWYWYSRPADTSDEVRETVTRRDVSETVSVSGELVPVQYADLSFQSIGVVDYVHVAEGGAVKAGDVLASLDRTVLQSQLNAARLALLVIEENEKLARRGWDDLKPEEQNAKRLTTEGAREDVRTLLASMERQTLIAPIDGTVSMLDLRVGETPAIGQAVMRVVGSSETVIKARVPESDIVKLSLGMKALVTFDALSSSDVFGAVVSAIEPAATVVSDVVSYETTFRMDGNDARLKEGMSADIDIVTAERKNVLAVPFRTFTMRGEKTYATVRRSETETAEVEVTTGLEGDDGTIEILTGLREGEVVIVNAVSE